MKKVLIINGNPKSKSFCGSLADSYEKGAKEFGNKVRRIELGKLKFNLNLGEGYDERTDLEKPLLKAQEDISWADHLVIVFPTWWFAMPALLKGFFDRVFLPGFAFKFHKNDPMWDKLLKGKSARVIITMDAPKFIYHLYGRPGERMVCGGILKFCGFRPVRVTKIGGVNKLDKKKLKDWLYKVKRLGRIVK